MFEMCVCVYVCTMKGEAFCLCDVCLSDSIYLPSLIGFSLLLPPLCTHPTSFSVCVVVPYASCEGEVSTAGVGRDPAGKLGPLHAVLLLL